jgi:hypothetical protein
VLSAVSYAVVLREAVCLFTLSPGNWGTERLRNTGDPKAGGLSQKKDIPGRK